MKTCETICDTCELKDRFICLEANIQTCKSCNEKYFAQSHEYPCPRCEAGKHENARIFAEAKEERLRGFLKHIKSEFNTYKTPRIVELVDEALGEEEGA